VYLPGVDLLVTNVLVSGDCLVEEPIGDYRTKTHRDYRNSVSLLTPEDLLKGPEGLGISFEFFE
jgi:hypothetical protein